MVVKYDDEWEYVKVKKGKKIIMRKLKGKLVKIGIEKTTPKRSFW